MKIVKKFYISIEDILKMPSEVLGELVKRKTKEGYKIMIEVVE